MREQRISTLISPRAPSSSVRMTLMRYLKPPKSLCPKCLCFTLTQRVGSRCPVPSWPPPPVRLRAQVGRFPPAAHLGASLRQRPRLPAEQPRPNTSLKPATLCIQFHGDTPAAVTATHKRCCVSLLITLAWLPWHSTGSGVHSFFLTSASLKSGPIAQSVKRKY